MSKPPTQPELGAYKEEMCLETNEKPYMELKNSISVPNGDDSQLLPGSSSSSGANEMDDDIEYYTISGKKPYFDVILSKSHVSSGFTMSLPLKIIPELPSALVPVVLTCRGKDWNTVYCGDRKGKRFGPGFKEFVIDNDLKVGDCCFFELMECSTAKIKFKVIILRGDLPCPQGDGETPDTAIVIE